ncbi:MAG: LptF/LptG family permease [Fimbriimonadaceae bacterium]|nr:LptF/LptG family permease [Fimbriimonadaceae bacterium]QYK57673.1 MAG: LptF/LptG family permease [Fimbriimonadaceae bacterium]
MKRVDRLVLAELWGPWAFGVAIFTVLIMAGSFLFELTRYLSEGVSPGVVLQLTFLLLPGVAAKTFPMAVLLASLLAFGRLSSDSEIVALKAAGFSVARIMVPVGIFGLAVFLLAFLFTERVVPRATQQAVEVRKQIDLETDGRTSQPTSRPVYERGRLRAFVVARDFNFVRRTLSGVTMVLYDKDEKPTAFLSAEEMRFTSEDDWRIAGGATLVPADGGSIVRFANAYPEGVTPLRVKPEELLAQTLRDLDALPMEAMAQQIETLKRDSDPDRAQIANLEFGYWNKLAVPLAALVFGLVGAPLGIRSHRVPASSGFWLAVVIIFGYLLMANVLSIAAQGGRFPAFVASFLPIAIGLIVAAVLIKRRDT